MTTQGKQGSFSKGPFSSIQDVQSRLEALDYFCDKKLATALYLAQELQKPLLVEGPAGVGKTELAKVVAGALSTGLIRLQCYEGLDEAKALYEWNYQKQLLRIQANHLQARSWEETRENIFSEEFFLSRPLLQALQAEKTVVLLIDELDKSDEEFESFLLEALSDYQITITEIGTIQAKSIPLAVLTSNNTRDFSDALKRRCIHVFIDYPDTSIELNIVRRKIPSVSTELARQAVEFVSSLRRLVLKKPPSISETLDWVRTLAVLQAGSLDRELVNDTLNILLKYRQDVEKAGQRLDGLLPSGK